jgi:hypothetical protein
MQPTFDQAFQLLNITRESGASLENLQALYNAGLLSDLLKAENPCKVNREEFRRLLGYDPSVFKVKMGGANNTDEITAALGFPFNDWITQANFPLTASETPTEDEIEIVDPGKSFSEEEGLAILKEKGLLRPTYEHGIRFAEQHGKATTSEKKPFVIFLHEAWLDPIRFRRIVFLNRYAKYRGLSLDYPDGRFDDFCVLAGVRPRK